MNRLPAALVLIAALAHPVAARPKSTHAADRALRSAAVPKSIVPSEILGVPATLHGMQYLYGSGEAAALTRQAWRGLGDYVDGHLTDGVGRGVVLAPGSTLTNPVFLPCEEKPPAIVLDLDETAILNLGAEYDELLAQRRDFDPAVWDRWEKMGALLVAPTPGAKEALDRLRDHGVTIIFNTNRARENAAEAQAAINAAGLGPAEHGKTLFLRGDDADGSSKDGRRALIAQRFCVLALGGDQLGDFTDLFATEPKGVAARRAAVGYSVIAGLWGNGWFVMPNPVYGSALKGEPDDIFPVDKQWRDPARSRDPIAAQPHSKLNTSPNEKAN